MLCSKHYKNCVFRRTQLFKNTVSKTPLFTHVKKQLFSKKTVSFWVLGNFRWNHYFYSFSGFSLFWSKKKFGQNRECARKCSFILPSWHKKCQAIFAKNLFVSFFSCLDDHLKNTNFWKVFWPFSILFLFLLQQQEDKNKKCNFLFENLNVDIPTILRKHYFGTNWHYLCLYAYPKNTIQLGKIVKSLDRF